MLAGKPHLLNKMVSFKMLTNDFEFFAKLNQQKFNILRSKTKKINFAIPQI